MNSLWLKIISLIYLRLYSILISFSLPFIFYVNEKNSTQKSQFNYTWRYHTWCDNDIYCLSADCLFVTGKVLLMSHLYYWYWYWSIPIIVPIPIQTPTDYNTHSNVKGTYPPWQSCKCFYTICFCFEMQYKVNWWADLFNFKSAKCILRSVTLELWF